MLGAIAGDIIGSTYEFNRVATYDFELLPEGSDFTDDTVCSIAIADALLNHKDLATTLWDYCQAYPNRGYGGRFFNWLATPRDKLAPYNSYGNGSAMRVSAVACLYNTLEETLKVAKQTAEITHNHPEGIKGAQAVAAGIFLARTGATKREIAIYINETFGYKLNRCYETIRAHYSYDVSCQGSVPEAITCFLESQNYEDCIRKAIFLGGDADTQACIAGGLAQAFYGEGELGIPEAIKQEVQLILPEEFLSVISRIYKI
jgi:ADP-ribosylglycohydrolase